MERKRNPSPSAGDRKRAKLKRLALQMKLRAASNVGLPTKARITHEGTKAAVPPPKPSFFRRLVGKLRGDS